MRNQNRLFYFLTSLEKEYAKKEDPRSDAYAMRLKEVREAMAKLEKENAELKTYRIGKTPIKDKLAERSCPRCFAYIPFDALNDPISYAPKFCNQCGQAFDWQEEEDSRLEW